MSRGVSGVLSHGHLKRVRSPIRDDGVPKLNRRLRLTFQVSFEVSFEVSCGRRPPPTSGHVKPQFTGTGYLIALAWINRSDASAA